MHHGLCFGDCKESTVVLNGAGVLVGRGPKKAIEPDVTAEIFAMASEVFAKPPRCPALPTDLQRTTLTYVHEGTTSRAVHVRNASCSPAMAKLEKRLEALH